MLMDSAYYLHILVKVVKIYLKCNVRTSCVHIFLNVFTVIYGVFFFNPDPKDEVIECMQKKTSSHWCFMSYSVLPSLSFTILM